MYTRVLSAALLALAVTSAARADIIELTDGRKITGTMSRNGDVITIKGDDGKITTAKPTQIAKVTLNSNITPEEAAAAEWGRLPSQVKAADDIQVVIDLYKKFIDRFPAAKQLDEAKSTLAVYTTMKDSDPVKFRGRWMPRAQVSVTLKKWTDAARPALDLYKTGRMKETLDALIPILKEDPQNPDAQALGGLAAYRMGTMPQSRTYFTNLAASDPGSLMAENNLAVVSTMQKQPGEAIQHYTKALTIMPDNRLLLDNIAEAIYAYTQAGGDKNSANFRALIKAYEPAETRMEEVMAKKNLVRWGSTWVTADQRARLLGAQDALRDMMSKLDAQYNIIRLTLANMENQIRKAQADCDNFQSIIATATAQIISSQAIPVDREFFAAQQNVAITNYNNSLRYRDQLRANYDILVSGTRDYIAQADKLKAAFAAGGMSGQYTGTQRILDLDETDTPPAPVPVAEPVLPEVQTPTIIITPPAAPTPPVLVPIPSRPILLVPRSTTQP